MVPNLLAVVEHLQLLGQHQNINCKIGVRIQFNSTICNLQSTSKNRTFRLRNQTQKRSVIKRLVFGRSGLENLAEMVRISDI